MSENHPDVLRESQEALSVASVARVYNYVEGCTENYAPDRELARRLLGVAPWLRTMVATDSWYRPRAVEVIARELGIAQFVDLGCGLPPRWNRRKQRLEPEPAYEVARAVHDAPRVVYVDNDWTVHAHARVELDAHEGTAAVRADVREIDTFLAHSAIACLRGAPTAFLLHDLLAWWDDEAAGRVLAALREWLPPGSAISITHVTSDRVPGAMKELADQYAAAGIHYRPRSMQEIAGLLDVAAPWELLEPGLVPTSQWRTFGTATVVGGQCGHSYAAVITKRAGGAA